MVVVLADCLAVDVAACWEWLLYPPHADSRVVATNVRPTMFLDRMVSSRCKFWVHQGYARPRVMVRDLEAEVTDDRSGGLTHEDRCLG